MRSRRTKVGRVADVLAKTEALVAWGVLGILVVMTLLYGVVRLVGYVV